MSRYNKASMDDENEAAFEEKEEILTKRAAQERLNISKLTREDLEDKYLKCYDENILLKKHGRKQEEKIKKMATKLIRLIQDKKRVNVASGGTMNPSHHKPMRDIDTDELINSLQIKLNEAEVQNKRLRENLQMSKMQLQSMQKKGTASGAYDGINARIDTGLPKKVPPNKNLRTISTLNGQSLASTGHLANAYQQSYSRNDFLNEISQLKEEKFDLQECVDRLKEQMAESNNQVDRLRNELHEKEINFEEDLSKLKYQVTHDQKQSLQENIDQIRLQRELKDKMNQYTELSQKYNNFAKQHATLKDNHDSLLNEIENFNQQLKQEQQRTSALRAELKQQSYAQRELLELKEQINDLKRDNEILKEANEKLMNSAFSLEREREFREKEKMLKIQIAQLEATLKSDVQEKGIRDVKFGVVPNVLFSYTVLIQSPKTRIYPKKI
jgi:protein fantom